MPYPKQYAKLPVVEETVDIQIVVDHGLPVVVLMRTGSTQSVKNALESGIDYNADYHYTPEQMALFRRVLGIEDPPRLRGV